MIFKFRALKGQRPSRPRPLHGSYALNQALRQRPPEQQGKVD